MMRYPIVFYFSLAGFLLPQDLFALSQRFRCVWNDDPSTTMTIIWDQVSGNEVKLFFDDNDWGSAWELYTNQQAPDEQLRAKGMYNQYVRLKNLKPDTKYYFVVKDSDSQSKQYWFRTAPADDQRTLSIIAGGDSRNNREVRRKANLLVAKLRPDVILFAGDMTASDISSQWIDWMNDWQLTIPDDGKIIPIIAARGNHEDSDYTMISMFDVPHPKVRYALNIGGDLLRVYTLNSMGSALGDQKNWLEKDLKASQSITWRFAQYHHPIRPHTAKKTEREEMRRHWAPLFHDYQVQMVLECDAHLVKTTWPVRPSLEDGHDEGFIRDDSTGTVYIGEGCWGAPLRPNNDDKDWTRASGSFNQIKWIFVSKEQVEIRTIKVDNARQVGALSEAERFFQPYNLEVWSPPTGEVVTLRNRYLPRSDRQPIAIRKVTGSIIIQELNGLDESGSHALFEIPVVADRAGKLIIERSLNGVFFQVQDTLEFSAPEGGKNTFVYFDPDVLKFGATTVYFRVYPIGMPEKTKRLVLPLNNWDWFEAIPRDEKTRTVPVDYAVSKRTDVRVKVFNDQGQLVSDFKFPDQEPGDYTRLLDATFWRSGIYLVLVQINFVTFPKRVEIP
ncbi:MAG: metallophosphoesterase family protein [Bacteroidota bacterium]